MHFYIRLVVKFNPPYKQTEPHNSNLAMASVLSGEFAIYFCFTRPFWPHFKFIDEFDGFFPITPRISLRLSSIEKKFR